MNPTNLKKVPEGKKHVHQLLAYSCMLVSKSFLLSQEIKVEMTFANKGPFNKAMVFQ